MSCYQQKPPEQSGVRPGKRKCLCCSRTFKSAGIHNRLCWYCTKKKRNLSFDEVEVVGFTIKENLQLSDFPITPIRPST